MSSSFLFLFHHAVLGFRGAELHIALLLLVPAMSPPPPRGHLRHSSARFIGGLARNASLRSSYRPLAICKQSMRESLSTNSLAPLFSLSLSLLTYNHAGFADVWLRLFCPTERRGGAPLHARHRRRQRSSHVLTEVARIASGSLFHRRPIIARSLPGFPLKMYSSLMDPKVKRRPNSR